MINHNSEALPGSVLSPCAVLRGAAPYYHHPHHTYFNTKACLTGGHPQVIHQSTQRQTTEWKAMSEVCNCASPSFSLLLHNGWLNKVTSGPQAAPHHAQSHTNLCFVISAPRSVTDLCGMRPFRQEERERTTTYPNLAAMS